MQQILGVAAIDATAAVVVFVALIRIVATPAERWPSRRLSKIAWALAAIYFTPAAHAVIFPVGAAVAIWHTHKLNKPAGPVSSDLPYATGRPDNPPRP